LLSPSFRLLRAPTLGRGLGFYLRHVAIQFVAERIVGIFLGHRSWGDVRVNHAPAEAVLNLPEFFFVRFFLLLSHT